MGWYDRMTIFSGRKGRKMTEACRWKIYIFCFISNANSERKKHTLNSWKKLVCPKIKGIWSLFAQANTNLRCWKSPTWPKMTMPTASTSAKLPVRGTDVFCFSHSKPNDIPTVYGKTLMVEPESSNPTVSTCSPPAMSTRGKKGNKPVFPIARWVRV